MAQSTGKEIQQIEELNRKKAAQTSRVADLDRERNEAKQELDSIETNRKAAVFGALDSMKKRYFSRLLGERGVKVKAPKVSSVVESSLDLDAALQDRKSTRLNSSHSQISYAVFCLKKKT